MAQTISELEKERAELLKAIESQAQQFSSDRQGQDDLEDHQEHTLKDWLNAAEEVMPSKPKPRKTQSPPRSNNLNTKASFFGVVIMLSLLLTILGVVYIAYTAIQKELSSVLSAKDEMAKELQLLKGTVTELQQNTAASGQGELFKQLQDKVAQLEQEVRDLKAQQLIAAPATSSEPAQNNESAKKILSGTLPDNVVTTEVLDAKLQEYTRGIEAKLEKILQALPQNTTSLSKQNLNTKTSPQSTVTVSEPEMDTPKEPTVKPLNQPVVRLVKKVDAPKQPEAAKEPLVNYTNDVKWLMNEPAFNFTLQLASMTERSSIQKLITQKGLKETKIIPQDRNGEIRYVLLTGSYSSRQAADNAATSYKADFGISPWVRKIKDLTSKVK